MADAAVLLCSAPAGSLAGRVVYSMELLGRPRSQMDRGRCRTRFYIFRTKRSYS
jgi:hypothetical protein